MITTITVMIIDFVSAIVAGSSLIVERFGSDSF